MAIRLRDLIQIDPIDTIEKRAVGIKLPFGKKNPFILDYTTKDHAKSKLINVLLTSPGERLYQPLFGVGLKNRLFEQQTEESQEELRSIINTQVGIFVPEVNVENIRFRIEDHILYVTINFVLVVSNEPESITLSFANTNNQTL
jgi:phage baseplate assembly protein W